MTRCISLACSAIFHPSISLQRVPSAHRRFSVSPYLIKSIPALLSSRNQTWMARLQAAFPLWNGEIVDILKYPWMNAKNRVFSSWILWIPIPRQRSSWKRLLQESQVDWISWSWPDICNVLWLMPIARTVWWSNFNCAHSRDESSLVPSAPSVPNFAILWISSGWKLWESQLLVTWRANLIRSDFGSW